MAVLFAKDPSQKETVNDLHGDLINLARVVADADFGPRLHGCLQRTLFCEAVLAAAQKCLSEPFEMLPAGVSDEMASRAYWYFLASWMARNGSAGTARQCYQIAVRWTKGGGSPTVRWRNAVESLPAWHRRLQNVVILQRDAFKIMTRFEDVPQTAIYVDPPYPAETRSKGATKNGAGGQYLHEFKHGDSDAETLYAETDDHARLAGILRKYQKARVVVSSYDCPRIRELYAGWTFVDHTRQKHLHAQNGRGARPKKAPEVLIINGPSFAQEGTA